MKKRFSAFVINGGIWYMDVYVMKTLECLWMVCHMGTFQLLEGCDKSSKPSLLILAEEVLSQGLQELVSFQMITPYHGFRSCPALSHLLFANDVLIWRLYNGHKRNLKKLKIFLETSQKLIVMAKRSISIRASASSRTELLAEIPDHWRGIKNGSFPIKYPDVPLSPKIIKREQCLPLLEKMKKRISGWKSKLLSSGGRLRLIQHVRVFRCTCSKFDPKLPGLHFGY